MKNKNISTTTARIAEPGGNGRDPAVVRCQRTSSTADIQAALAAIERRLNYLDFCWQAAMEQEERDEIQEAAFNLEARRAELELERELECNDNKRT